MLALEERWLPVPGFEGFYECSDLGRIRRLVGHRCRVVRYLVHRLGKTGYCGVTLYGPLGALRTYFHRVVLLTFVGPCPEGHNVNHKDGIKANNRLSNLEYVTPKENSQHSVRTGLHNFGHMWGEGHGSATITEAQAQDVLDRTSIGERNIDIAPATGVKYNIVALIKYRRIWRHLSPAVERAALAHS